MNTYNIHIPPYIRLITQSPSSSQSIKDSKPMGLSTWIEQSQDLVLPSTVSLSPKFNVVDLSLSTILKVT